MRSDQATLCYELLASTIKTNEPIDNRVDPVGTLTREGEILLEHEQGYTRILQGMERALSTPV